MAFNKDFLSRSYLGSGNSFSLWSYETEDFIDDILINDYFISAFGSLREDDVIALHDNEGYKWLRIVTSNKNTVVVEQINFVTPLAEQGLMNWRGEWDQSLYRKNDVVTDGEWLMVAVADTNDRAAPEPLGLPSFTFSDTPGFATQNNNSVIYSGNIWTANEGGWVDQIRVWVPTVGATITHRIYIRLDIPGKAPEINYTDLIGLTAGTWVPILNGTKIIPKNTVITILIETIESTVDTVTNEPWAYLGPSQLDPPALGQWNRNIGQSIVRINKIDDNSVVQNALLATVQQGSTIQIENQADSTQYWLYDVNDVTEFASHYEYDVSFIETGPGGDVPTRVSCNIIFTVPTTQPASYSELSGFFPGGSPSWGTAQGQLSYGNITNIQPGSELNAYGVDILFQRALVSEDWAFMALSDVSPTTTQLFIELLDTPNSYGGEAGQSLRVNPTADALEYFTPNLFGSEYQYEVSEGESSTSSGSFQNKLTLTTTDLPAGNYRLSWNCETRNNSEEDGVEWRVQLDDTDTLALGRFDNPEDLDDTYLTNAGFALVALDGVHTFDIDYRRRNGGTARIRRARLEVFRVS